MLNHFVFSLSLLKKHLTNVGAIEMLLTIHSVQLTIGATDGLSLPLKRETDERQVLYAFLRSWIRSRWWKTKGAISVNDLIVSRTTLVAWSLALWQSLCLPTENTNVMQLLDSSHCVCYSEGFSHVLNWCNPNRVTREDSLLS